VRAGGDVRSRAAPARLFPTGCEPAVEVRGRAFAVGTCNLLELTTKRQQQGSQLGPTVKLGLDACEHAPVIPERALLARARLLATFRDQPNRAQRRFCVRDLHDVMVGAGAAAAISRHAD